MEEAVSKPVVLCGEEASELQGRIAAALEDVIDPETGLSVMRMGLVKDTEIERGDVGCRVTVTLEPSSPICPMAFKLAWDMKKTVEGLAGVERAVIKVKGYNRAAELEAVVNAESSSEGSISRSRSKDA